MSLTMTLVPMGLTLLILTGKTGVTIAEAIKESVADKKTLKLETTYTDCALLAKTLTEHGWKVEIADENHVKTVCDQTVMNFTRESVTQPFTFSMDTRCALEGLEEELVELDQEYGLNVQEYTYKKVLNGLEDNMTVESEEVLEDNTILLTINID